MNRICGLVVGPQGASGSRCEALRSPSAWARKHLLSPGMKVIDAAQLTENIGSGRFPNGANALPSTAAWPDGRLHWAQVEEVGMGVGGGPRLERG